MKTGDTITAIATPPGRSGRGIVRASGPGSFGLIRTISSDDRDISEMKISMRGVHIECLQIGAINLPCMIASFPAPRSYTGEDTFEIITVGNPHLLNRIVELLVHHGARQAEAGEFSARAYFNGRMTLAQAEGVAATIAAASDAQLRAAQLLTGGALGRICRSLSDRLAKSLALVEAGIDFVDQEDVVPISNAELLQSLRAIVVELDDLLRHAAGMEQLSALPRVVIVGPPNAGKSTLFNTLLGRERAVVTDVSGTTRDVLEEPMHLDPDDPFSPEILLTDIAGLDVDDAGLNPLMQNAARRAIDNADLIVYLHPSDHDAHTRARAEATHRDVFEQLERQNAVIHVQSKADRSAHRLEANLEFDLAISSMERRGLDQLRVRIGEQLADRTSSLSSDAIALESRHDSALRSSRDCLDDVCALLSQEAISNPVGFLPDVELIAVRLRLALDALGQITGEVTPDDVLGHIFATFCVGK